MTIEFNAERHEYKTNGVIVPSVTQILQAEGLSDFSAVPKDRLEYSLALGSAVHRGAELHELGTLDETTVDPEVKLRLDQWLLFLDHSKAKEFFADKKRHVEIMLASKIGFAGTLDRLYVGAKAAIIVDIKTGIETPAAPIQTAGYSILALENYPAVKTIIRMCVYLKADKFKVVYNKDLLDAHIFRSALNIYNFKKRNNLL